jgi:hypothetical protein
MPRNCLDVLHVTHFATPGTQTAGLNVYSKYDLQVNRRFNSAQLSDMNLRMTYLKQAVVYTFVFLPLTSPLSAELKGYSTNAPEWLKRKLHAVLE